MVEMLQKLVISYSALSAYLDCPRKYYYSHCRAVPKMTDYPRLFGVEIHKHIAQFYRPTRQPRAFYFKNKNAAIKSWLNRWQRALEKAKAEKKLMLIDIEKEKKYAKAGIFCIADYWDKNFGLPRPLEVEGSHKISLDKGIVFKGVFDQIREVSLKWITHHRPELINQGKLEERFDNKVIVDLKTNYLSYDPRQFKENPSLEEKIRLQYELHEDLQVTAFTFLYEKVFGKKPIGFLWYHLRSGKVFFTYREDRDYHTLADIINHFLENIKAQSFPKHVGRHCKYCDYLKPCREDRFFMVVQPEEVSGNLLSMKFVPNVVKREKSKQLKLKLKIKRKKRPNPVVKIPEEITLRNLPWDSNDCND